MMRLQTYAGFSFLATIAAIYHAFHSREQFYPAMVYLSTSKLCFVLLLNMGFVVMCILWQLVKCVFLGTLREAEVERLNEQAWKEVMEILFAITIFRQDFSITSLALVTALLLIKALHWLAQKRVEHIETTPSVSLLSHIRIVSFMTLLLVVDCLFLYNSVKLLLQSWTASLALFFSFEYMILASTTISTFLKYAFYVWDMLMEGQWDKKAIFTFYLELVRDLLHLTLYLCYFLVICANYNPPLHLIRELYETFRSFRIRIADYILYRKMTANMDERFPDATTEELNASDATCVICREEMTMAKKLLCGHLFHKHCLKSWLERHNTCPTCRASVDPSQNLQSQSTRQAGPPTASPSTQNSGSGASGDYISQHQARLKAASLAASIYGKSSIYPSTNTLFGSPGYPLLPQINFPVPDAFTSGFREAIGEVGPLEQQNGYPHVLIPSQLSGFSLSSSRTLGSSDLPSRAYKTAIQAHIEMLSREKEAVERELQILQQQRDEPKTNYGDAGCSVDGKGKAIRD